MSSDERAFFQTGELLRQKAPLIHCITSPIAVNDCANAVLALGARPIMAEHPEEAAGITAISASLGVSLANITDARIHSIFLSGAMALEQKKPSVIDVVGVNCSPMRMGLAKRFIQECHPAVIKGNASEIRALAGASFGEAGIDTAESDRLSPDNAGAIEAMAQILSSLWPGSPGPGASSTVSSLPASQRRIPRRTPRCTARCSWECRERPLNSCVRTEVFPALEASIFR